jgi:preprotein translocase subunit Sec61beta
MSLRFDPASFVRATLLFVILVLLATFGRDLGWVRSFLGDVLAVAWVFYVIRTFVEARANWIAAIAFATGAAVELAQFLLTSMDVQIPNRSLRIFFGATPDWWDILAYAIGAALVLGVDFMTAARGRAIQDKP